MTLITGVIGLVVGGALGVLSATFLHIRADLDEVAEVLRAVVGALEEVAEGFQAPDIVRLRDLEDQVERLPKRWEEFKNEATRAESRARAIVRDARRELAESGYEHAALEAQGAELRLHDGDGGEGEGVQSVRRAVGGDAQSDAVEALKRRKFGG